MTDHNIPYAAPPPDDIDTVLRKYLNVLGDNIRLREDLATARKARDAAQELLENERAKIARLEAQMATARGLLTLGTAKIAELRAALDILRVNDASTIADLRRQLHEAKGQLGVAQGYWHDIKALQAQIAELQERLKQQGTPVIGAENISRAYETIIARHSDEVVELRRTIYMAGTYLKELQALLGGTKGEKS